jgi:hypothetical protein
MKKNHVIRKALSINEEIAVLKNRKKLFEAEIYKAKQARKNALLQDDADAETVHITDCNRRLRSIKENIAALKKKLSAKPTSGTVTARF